MSCPESKLQEVETKELEYANRELQEIDLRAERKAGELLNKKQEFLSNDKEK